MKTLVALGGNVGEVDRAFRRAVRRLRRADGISVLRCSNVYRTKAVGPVQPDYLNAAVLLDVGISLVGLLDLCQRLEAEAGRSRRRETRWGPRPLDLDLLMAEHRVCRGPRLVLPHPRLCERAFALIPAAELAPDWVHPDSGRTLEDLSKDLVLDDGWRLLSDFSW